MVQCSSCGEDFSRKSFSNSQLQKKEKRRCKSCVDQPLQAQLASAATDLPACAEAAPAEGSGSSGLIIDGSFGM